MSRFITAVPAGGEIYQNRTALRAAWEAGNSFKPVRPGDWPSETFNKTNVPRGFVLTLRGDPNDTDPYIEVKT